MSNDFTILDKEIAGIVNLLQPSKRIKISSSEQMKMSDALLEAIKKANSITPIEEAKHVEEPEEEEVTVPTYRIPNGNVTPSRTVKFGSEDEEPVESKPLEKKPYEPEKPYEPSKVVSQVNVIKSEVKDTPSGLKYTSNSSSYDIKKARSIDDKINTIQEKLDKAPRGSKVWEVLDTAINSLKTIDKNISALEGSKTIAEKQLSEKQDVHASYARILDDIVSQCGVLEDLNLSEVSIEGFKREDKETTGSLGITLIEDINQNTKEISALTKKVVNDKDNFYDRCFMKSAEDVERSQRRIDEITQNISDAEQMKYDIVAGVEDSLEDASRFDSEKAQLEIETKQHNEEVKKSERELHELEANIDYKLDSIKAQRVISIRNGEEVPINRNPARRYSNNPYVNDSHEDNPYLRLEEAVDHANQDPFQNDIVMDGRDLSSRRS